LLVKETAASASSTAPNPEALAFKTLINLTS